MENKLEKIGQNNFMDNFVILQQMVAIDRAQNRFELRASIQTLLRIIGSCTSSERVYIFDWDETDNVFRNSYEWCGDNVQPWIDNPSRSLSCVLEVCPVR